MECTPILDMTVPALPFLWRRGTRHPVRDSVSVQAFWVTAHQGDGSVHINDIISHVGQHARHTEHTLHTIPPKKCTTATKTSLRTHFWERMNHLVQQADTQGKRWNETQWTAHLDNMNALLKTAPHPWLRRLYSFAEHPTASTGTPGAWIYALWSTRTNGVYVGQSGAIRQLKKCVTRYSQHTRTARSWHTLFGRHGVRRLGKLYPVMARIGGHHFGILPLQRLQRVAEADGGERYWIRKVGKNLNTRGIYPTDRRWKLLVHGKLVTPKYTKQQIADLTHRLGDRLRCPFPIHTQLHILTLAKKYCSGPVRNRCYQKVAHRIRTTTGLQLPNHAPLRVPCMHDLEAAPLTHTMRAHIDKLPLPLHLRKYISSVASVVQVRNPTVADALRAKPRVTTLHAMRDKVAAPQCPCAELHKKWGIPLIDGHIFARHPQVLSHIFGKRSKILTQNAKNDIVPAWESVKRPVIQSLRNLFLKLLPEKTSDAAVKATYSAILKQVKQVWFEHRKKAPWILWEQAIRDFAAEHVDTWKLEISDKNAGQITAHCWVGAMKSMLDNLDDPEQFEVIEVLPTPREAQDRALSLLQDAAHRNGLKKHWAKGKRKGPPSTRFLSKNKYDELIGWRRPPSHFRLHLIPMETWVHHILPHCLQDTRALWALVTANSLILSHFA